MMNTIVILLAVGFIGNALVSWRTVGILKNDIKHLEKLMTETRQDVRDMREYWRGD